MVTVGIEKVTYYEYFVLVGVYLTALMCITAMSTVAHVVCDKLVASANVRNEIPYIIDKVSIDCLTLE